MRIFSFDRLHPKGVGRLYSMIRCLKEFYRNFYDCMSLFLH
jgi:hypothetical protein